MKPTKKMLELAKDKTGTPMRVCHEIGSYNSKRMGKPWIAIITAWAVGEYPTLTFGASTSHCAEILASAGDVVKAGQKDHRKPRQSDNDFYLVQKDGSLLRITEGQARELYLERDGRK